MQAVLRWKNGDRQFVELDIVNVRGGKPAEEIMYKVGGEEDVICGDHAYGTIVRFQLNASLWHFKSQVVYIEVP